MHGLQIVATLIMEGGFFPAPFLFKGTVMEERSVGLFWVTSKQQGC